MRWLLRSLVVVMVLFAASPAEARRGGGLVVFNTGEDIVHIRDLPAETAQIIGFESLGYKYTRFGLFWLDLWRWDGELVVYSGDTYAPVGDEVLESLGGASTPWKYHFPPGLLLLLGALELWIMIKQRRRVKVVLGIGAGLVLFALLLFVKGVDKAFAIPGLLGLHHLVTAWFGTRGHDDEALLPDAITDGANGSVPDRAADARTSAAVAARRSDASIAHSPAPAPAPAAGVAPALATDALARPSQPLEVHRPPTAPAEVPIVHDASAEGPKLLR